MTLLKFGSKVGEFARRGSPTCAYRTRSRPLEPGNVTTPEGVVAAEYEGLRRSGVARPFRFNYWPEYKKK